MPRAPSDPSGAKIVVSVTLSPDHLRRLDEMAGARALSRSAMVTRLIERAASTPAGPQAPTHRLPAANCTHPNPIDSGGGMARCPDCGWRRGKDTEWRAPK